MATKRLPRPRDPIQLGKLMVDIVSELVQVKNRDGKLVWPETEDFRKGRRRFKSDLVPRAVLIARYFVAERARL
jgi:hypothetical protein